MNNTASTGRYVRKRRLAHLICPLFVVVLLSVSPHVARAQIDSHRSGIVLRASSTINTGVSVDLEAITSEFPLGFTVEVIPVGGTVSLELDGDLVVSWDRGDVSAGGTIDLFTRLVPGQDPTDAGTLRTSFRYLVTPGYWIDFHEVFHNASAHWGQNTPELRKYIIDGVRSGKIPLGVSVTPVVEHEFINQIDATVDSLFLLSDSLVVGETLVDTRPLSYSFTPYPCVRFDVNAELKTMAAVTVGVDNLCLRYAPPADTLCWDVDNVVTCQSLCSTQQSFAAGVPCAAVKDWVVPMCPVEASGYARVKIRSILDVTSLELHYTCDPPGLKGPGQIPPIESPSVIQSDSTWFNEQKIDLKTDRDDMIFTIPVPLDTVIAGIKYGDSTLSQGDSVVVGREYAITWSPIDSTLRECCTDVEEVRLVYRSAEDLHAHPDDACYIELEASASSSAGTYSWTPSPIGCSTNGQKFIVFLEFICSGTGEVLYRTRTDWYKYY